MFLACNYTSLKDILQDIVKKEDYSQTNSEADRESIQPWPCGAIVCDFQSCCLHTVLCHFDRNITHCPDTNVRSFLGEQHPYLKTRQILTDGAVEGVIKTFNPSYHSSYLLRPHLPL